MESIIHPDVTFRASAETSEYVGATRRTIVQSPVILVIPAWDEAASMGAVLSEVSPELVGE